MSLMRQTFQPAFARMLLAIALTCALLVTQFVLFLLGAISVIAVLKVALGG